MKIIILGILCAFLAFAYAKVFNSTAIDILTGKIESSNPKHGPETEPKEEPTTESEEKGEIIQDPNSPVNLQVGSYLVLILENATFIKGSGLITGVNFLITAAVILEDIAEHYGFKTRFVLGRKQHTIFRDHPNRPLTIAFFEPPIENNYMIPVLPFLKEGDEKPGVGDVVMSLGHTEKKIFKKKYGRITGFVKNGYVVHFRHDGCQYRAQPGDVLVRLGKILGHLVNILNPDKNYPSIIFMHY